ncbi:hypothetical protein FQR65_LT19557 [Abscondita terminalis]|nr:hypothetical protein FQR65_LT19557 [Abscondita terminalis]
MIRSRLRLLGRLMLIVKSECSKISSLSDALHPKIYDTVIKSVNIVAGLDRDGLSYKTPTNATNLGTFLKNCSRLLITECIKNQLLEKQKEVEDFLKLVEDDYGSSVNVAALENLAELKRQKPITLPSTEDIRTLLEYLRKKRDNLYTKLKHEFDFVTWKECASVTLTTIQVFNRRRAGEIERLKISDFLASQSVTDEMYSEILPNLHKEEQLNADKYLRCQLRGKLGRNVSVLIEKEEFKVLQLIISERENAGVTSQNPYVFGIPGNQGVQCYLSACRLLQKYSDTHLRKHMATHSANYNLNDSEFMDLTNFMGHAEKIHKDHYRLPVATREITRISSILQKAQGVQSIDNISLNSNSPAPPPPQEAESTENTIISLSTSETNTSSGTSIKKKRSVSPMGRVQRRSWTSEEIKIVNHEFQQHLRSNSLPSLSQCEFVKNKYSVLQKRTAAQIKSWLDNQVRSDQRKKDRHSERKTKIIRNKWSSPEKQIMQKHFHYHLQHRTLPSRNECIQVKQEELILKDRSVEVIKAWINNENKKATKT